MSLEQRISRRKLLRITGAGVVGIAGAGLIAACTSDDDDEPGADASSDDDSTGDAGDDEGDDEEVDEPDDSEDETPDEADDEEEEEDDAPPVPGADLIGDLEGPTIVTDPDRWPTEFNEAPELAELVAAGDLPPVEERIGEDPLVIEPLHEIGQYGGTWRRGFTGPGDKWNGYRVAGSDALLGWHYEGQEPVPNIALQWEFSEDGQNVTFHLRRGMRWSDGEPFTADDFVFWYEDLFSNDEVMPIKSADMSVGGELGEMAKVDDYTVEFTFAEPYFLFTARIAGAGALGGQAIQGLNANGTYAPAHYLRRFHADYADADELDAAVDEAGVEDWVTLLKQKNDWTLNPDLPVVTPWKVDSPINTTTYTLVRNPYSIWVDTEGNQLPYIDEIVMTLAEDLEVINLRAIAGEYDLQARHIDMAKLPVILENREEGDYTVHLDIGDYGSDMALNINRSYNSDPEIEQWLKNVDFRRALSLAIERDQLNETFWLGTGEPGSPCPGEVNKYFPGEEYRTLWHVYDPDQANQMLDDLGLTERDGDGYRMRTDGEGRLQIELMTVGAQFIPYTQIGEMIQQNWADIGIFLTISEVERSLWGTIIESNDYQITAWNNDGSENLYIAPKTIFPYSSGDSNGPLHGQWYVTNGEQGEEPPEDIRENMEMYRQGLIAPEDEQIEIGKELWRRSVDSVNSIGIVGLSAAAMGVRLVKNNMRNVPARQYNSPIVKNPVISCPPTFYFTD